MVLIPNFSDDEKYPIEASQSGDNAYYFTGCPVSSGRLNYAACLAKCRTRKAGKLGEQYSDCSVLIGKRQCKALEMFAEEKEAGVALYFTSRLKLITHNEYRTRVERQTWEHFQKTGKRVRKPLEEEIDETAPIEDGDDIAPFNAPEVQGYTPPVSPSIERASGLGTYAYREYSHVEREELPETVAIDSDDESYTTARVNYEKRRAAAHSAPSAIEKSSVEKNEMADLISSAVKEAMAEKEPETPVKKKTTRPPINPGESPLDYARRVAAMNKD